MGNWKNPFENESNKKKEDKEEFSHKFEEPKNLNELFPPNELEDCLDQENWKSMRYFSKQEGNYKLTITTKEDYRAQKFTVNTKLKIKYNDDSTLEQKLESFEYDDESIYRQMLPKVMKIYHALIKQSYEKNTDSKPEE